MEHCIDQNSPAALEGTVEAEKQNEVAMKATFTNSEAILATGNIEIFQEENKMTKEEFWAINDSSLVARDQDEQARLIEGELLKLSDTKVLQFSEVLFDLCNELEDWPLWGAGFVLGFSSQAEFFNFCLWLISKGQSVYKNTQKNPDYLVEVITQKDIDVEVNFEKLLFIVWDVYIKKTGKKIKIGVRSNFKQKRIGNFAEAMKMVFSDGTGKKDLRNSGGGWNFTDLYEMDKRYPKLLHGFFDCYLSSKPNPLKGKKLGLVLLDGELVKCDDLVLTRF